MSCWTQSKEKSKRVKPARLSKHRKSRYENRQTRVRILHDRFSQRIHYLRRKAKNFSFDVFTAMENIIPPPVRRLNKRNNEGTFFKGIIDVLFASKLAMMRRIVSKQRDAGSVMESITNKPTEEQRRPNGNDIPRGTPNEHVNVTTTTTAKSTTKGTVLLQTASCMAVNGSNSIPVRVLFDNGSQRSYVSSSVTSRLNLRPVSSKNLHINTFGGHELPETEM